MAPEIFKQNYNHQVDLWSAGILLFEIVTGELPYYAKYSSDIQKMILDQNPKFDAKLWSNYSPDLLDLAQHLLQKDPKKRLTVTEALQHPFIQVSRKRSKSNDFNNQMYDSVNRLKSFRAKTKLQQATLTYLSMQNNNDEERNLIQIFNEIDENGDSKITQEELALALRRLFNTPIEEAELTSISIMNQIDLDKNGYLDYSEFVMACSKRKELISEDQLKEAFQQFDLNNDGKISVDELKQVLVQDDEVQEEKWMEIIQEVDIDGDGQVSFEEFKEMMNNINKNE